MGLILLTAIVTAVLFFVNHKLGSFNGAGYATLIFAWFSFIILLVMIIIVFVINVGKEESHILKSEHREAIINQANKGIYADKIGIEDKNIITLIEKWNAELKTHQYYSTNAWLSIFYPKEAIEGLEVISYDIVKSRDASYYETDINIKNK